MVATSQFDSHKNNFNSKKTQSGTIAPLCQDRKNSYTCISEMQACFFRCRFFVNRFTCVIMT